MSFTPEQKAANDKLEDAIQEVIKVYNLLADGSVVTDYMVVGEAMGFHEDDRSSTQVFLAYRGGQIRNSVALGLFDLGYDQYKAGMEPILDDED